MTILRALLVIALSTIGLSAWADKVDVNSSNAIATDKSAPNANKGTFNAVKIQDQTDR